MKLFSALLLAAAGSATASCPNSLPLKGMLTVPNCVPMKAGCQRADEALYAYMKARPNQGDEVLTIGLHGSPWHLFGPDQRILDIEQLAAMVRQHGSKIRRVELLSSWSGVAPDAQRQSLARQLSQALGGMAVDGQDGFLWFERNGRTRTTRQAFTAFATGPYAIEQGSAVMAALVTGWTASYEARFLQQKDANALLGVGVGHETFGLCPARALAAFEAAAALAQPVAAYNAAILRLERDTAGDKDAARALLARAAAQGDQPSAALLERLTGLTKQEEKR